MNKMKNLITSNMPSPILITGAARSGTSLIAGAINSCGAYGGKMSGPNKNNAKGMFENVKIRNDVLKPYLREMGFDPMGQYPLPIINKLSIPVNWKDRVESIIKQDGYIKGSWMYKGAKMCLTWPIWSHAFPDAKWVIVRRKSEDIADSCMRTHFMRAFGNPANQTAVGVKSAHDGWLWWAQKHLERFREMQDAGLNVKVIWPERMVSGDYTQIMDTIEWLGLKWNSQVVASFIDPKLWHARNKV